MERRSARSSAGPAGGGGANKNVAETPGAAGRSPRSNVQQSTPAKKAVASPSKVAVATKAAVKQMPSSSVSVATQEVPASTPEGGEVLLNRRGGSARQIKRNRFYYGGDNVNEDNWKQVQKEKMTPRKVKQEPVEVVEEEELGFNMDDLMHTEEVVKSTPVRPSPKKATIASRPTSAQVGQAVTAMIKPKQGMRLGKPEKGIATPRKEAGTSRNADSPKTPKLTLPIKLVQAAKGSASVPPKGSKTPISKPRPAASKSASKADALGKVDRYLYASGVVSESPRQVIIKKERDSDMDTDLFFSDPNETSLADEKQIRKEKERIVREKERREFRREKERQERDETMIPSSSHKARNRRISSLSMGDSFSESMNVPLDTVVETAALKPTLDKKTAQEISLRLRNLLKLPKAHKWVCYEWFYSNIDKVLFEGENDFQTCFRESFPQLKARKLTRTEWTKIRRLMGKPRRCSQSFFDEEREELARRRQKIRMIQQRKVTDFNYKELPDEIPLQLVIGTKVTSRLRRPQDGLFTGTVDGVDTSNNTYRITFDRVGLGTHSIPDYEVLSNEAPETVSTSSFALKIPRRSYGAFSGGQFKFQSSGHGEEAGGFPKPRFPVDGMLGGFPIRLLDMIVRLSKLLKAKREKILQLKELNVEAEKMRSYGKSFNTDFRTRYARCVLDLSSMNKEMALYLDGVQQYCLEIAPDHGAHQMIIPEHVQEQCDHEASLIVTSCNNKPNRGPAVVGTKAISLITKLTSMLLQAKALSPGDRNLYEVKSIRDSLKEMKAGLEGQNVQLFQDRIEIPMNRIQAGLTLSAASKYQNNLQ